MINIFKKTPKPIPNEIFYVTEQRRLGNKTITFVFTSHDPKSMPSIAAILKTCDVVAIKSPGFASEVDKSFKAGLFSILINPKTNPDLLESLRANYGVGNNEIIELIYALRGSGKQIQLIDMDAIHHDFESVVALQQAKAAYEASVRELQPVATNKRLIAQLAKAAHIAQPERDKELQREVLAIGTSTKAQHLGVVTGAAHMSVVDGVGELVGQSAKDMAINLARGLSYFERLVGSYEQSDQPAETLLDRATLQCYMTMHGIDTLRSFRAIAQLDDQRVAGILLSVDNLIRNETHNKGVTTYLLEDYLTSVLSTTELAAKHRV